MKRFLILSLLMVSCLSGWSCMWEAIHDYYIFSAFHRSMMQNPFEQQCIDNWAAYTQHTTDGADLGEVKAYAAKKGDQAMTKYLTCLEQYLDICREKRDEQWDYPTPAQLQEQSKKLQTLRQTAKQNLRSALRSQWALLYMRCNMLLGDYQRNIKFWNATAKKLPQTVYREMMRNVYANALNKTQRAEEALAIYAEQGDMESIRWCNWEKWNSTGIESVYNNNPTSPALVYLVQTFVNDYQLAWDGKSYAPTTAGARQEAQRMIRLADRVVKEGKTTEPALWASAAAWLECLYGYAWTGLERAEKAVSMKGSARIKDNARVVKLFCRMVNAEDSKDFDDYVTGELQWLCEKAKSEPREYENGRWTNHYIEVIDRLSYMELADRYKSMGRMNTAAALMALPCQLRDDEATGDPRYDSDLFTYLQQLDPHAAARFFDYARTSQPRSIDNYLRGQLHLSADFENDLVGTRHLAYGEWADAIQRLERVDIKFMAQQNIASLMKVRNYKIEKWLHTERTIADGPDESLSVNQKLAFAREMNRLEEQYRMANKKSLPQLAYDLATRYYQASCKGNCWYLTHYDWSTGELPREGEKDFIATTQQLLRQAAATSDFRLKEKALYALAYVPTDEWREEQYDAQRNDFFYVLQPESDKYKALNALHQFRMENASEVSSYISKCDVLKTFAQQ